MGDYRFEGEVHTNRARSMGDVTDVIADALEKAFGVTEDEYAVVVHGPPELRIGIVERGSV